MKRTKLNTSQMSFSTYFVEQRSTKTSVFYNQIKKSDIYSRKVSKITQK